MFNPPQNYLDVTLDICSDTVLNEKVRLLPTDCGDKKANHPKNKEKISTVL